MQTMLSSNDSELKNTEKSNSVDMLLALRAFACLLVVSHHSIINMHNNIWLENNKSIWPLFSPAWVGIWIFFVLSGYLMGKGFFTDRYSRDKKGAINFYINRAIRILPLYYFAILIEILFLSPELLKGIN